jgi:hypothetical protein
MVVFTRSATSNWGRSTGLGPAPFFTVIFTIFGKTQPFLLGLIDWGLRPTIVGGWCRLDILSMTSTPQVMVRLFFLKAAAGGRAQQVTTS